MAFEGELVRMDNGKWGRFQRCVIDNAGHQDAGPVTVLVAVELDEHYQDLLNAAEDSLESYRARGIPVRIRLDPDGKGTFSLAFGEGESAVR